MCSARQVWKPLEWAEMPRMAWKLTGRPMKVSWRSPRKSVQGWSISMAWLKATSTSSAASRLIVAAAMPQRPATASGLYSGSRYFCAISSNTGVDRPPPGVGKSPFSAGFSPGLSNGCARLVARSQTSALPSPSRTNRPKVSPGLRSISQGALVQRQR